MVKLRMTLVSCVKPTESYEVYRLGRQLGSTFTGTDRNGPAAITASDQTVQVVHSCNSWL